MPSIIQRIPRNNFADTLTFVGSGLLGAGVFLAGRLLWPDSIAVLFALCVLTMSSAAVRQFQSGFASFCDGFGGGRKRERILAIMADSNIGVFGAVGLTLVLLLQFAILRALSESPMQVNWTGWPAIPGIVPAIFAGQSMSHLFALVLARTLPGQNCEESETIQYVPQTGQMVFAGIVALIALSCFSDARYWLTLLPLAAFFVWLRRLFLRRIGGMTPDLIGAAGQLSRCLFLLTVLGLAGLPETWLAECFGLVER